MLNLSLICKTEEFLKRTFDESAFLSAHSDAKA